MDYVMPYAQWDEGIGLRKGEKEPMESTAARKIFKTMRENLATILDNENNCKLVFTTKFSESEKKRLLKGFVGDENYTEEDHLRRMKDIEFNNILGMISDRESQHAFAIIVFTGIKPLLTTRFDYGGVFERYYSLEEYLTIEYGSEDFDLYVTASNELILDFDNRRTAVIALKPEGDMLYRAMIHEPTMNTYRKQMIYIYKNIFLNKKIIARSNILAGFERPRTLIGKPKSITPGVKMKGFS